MVGNLAPIRAAFFNGPNGQRLTEDQIRTRSLIARTLLQSATDTSPTAGGWASILAKGAAGLASNYQEGKADAAAAANLKATSDADNSFYSSLAGTLGGGDASAALPTPGAVGEVAATDPGASNDIQSQFLDTVKTGVTNPYGLAAIAATGNAESSFSPKLAGSSWNDGKNNAGGIMSWNGPRLANLQKFSGGTNGTPQQQGQFFLQENPDLIAKLNSAKSVGEAQNLMNNAWAFKGYNQPGNANAAHRLALAQGYLPQFAGQAQPLPYGTAPVTPVQTASLGPVNPADATASLAPAGPYVDPQVTTAAQAPNPSVAQALLGSPQDVTSSATPVSDVVKGGRVGGPAITQQSFDDRMGGAAPAAAPVAPFDPSTVQDYGTQAPQGAPTPQQAPVTPPQLARPSLPPLNPAVVRALQDPNASPQTKQVAASLLTQYGAQRKAYEEQGLKAQQTQQALAQRQAVAQQLGIEPALAGDDDAWKEALKAQSTGGGILNLGNGHLYNTRKGEFFSDPNASDTNFRPATPDEVKSFGTNGQVDAKTGRFYPVTPPQGTSLSVDPTTGAVSFNQGAGVKPMTEGQSKDAFFTTRMTAAAPTLDQSEKALTSFGEKNAGSLPMGLGNYMQSEEYQLANGAGRDFVLAYLRKDSGAAISPAEEKTYGELLLPQPGDSASVIAAKRQRREVAVEAIKSGMPQQALDGVVRAIKSVPGADKPNVPGGSDIPPAPADVDPNIWKFMTPEQRKLWQ